MISVKRTAVPPLLTDPEGIWVKETQRAIAHYSIASQLKAFEHNAYSDSRLKDALKNIFVKCAYCESVYAATSDGDIEHFRPKGRVQGKNPETPGYYWLSNDWDNLLLSCQHCNQSRRHQISGLDDLQRQGKLDQFPLSDESKRVTKPGSLDEEEQVRLLINPCKENPELHFKYDETEGVMIPVTRMGETSIEVYALQRKLLVDERKKRLLDLLQQIKRAKRALETFNTSATAANEEVFKEEFSILKRYAAPESPYAGMARFFVRRFLQENGLA